MKKNVMKNILAVSVVAAMAMSVAACGNTTETSAETEETVVETSEETVAETEETVAETEETVAETEETAAETEESAAAIELDGEIDEEILAKVIAWIGTLTTNEDLNRAWQTYVDYYGKDKRFVVAYTKRVKEVSGGTR